MGAVVQGISPSIFFQHSLVFACILFQFIAFKFNPSDRPHSLIRIFSFTQGLDLLKRTNALREELQRLEEEGLCKIETVVTGSEAEGFYGLLKEAVSHTSLSSIPIPSRKCHPALNATASKPPLQEPSRVAPEVSVPVAEEKEQTPEAPMKLALEAPSLVVQEALDVAIPAHMTPLCLQLWGTKRIYQCWVEGCS